MRILLAEDDPQFGESLEEALTLEGYAVDRCLRGDSVLPALALAPYDALILDIGLPGSSGFAVLKQLRERGSLLPVLLLTARDAVSDRVKGLDLGADDYLGKPFAMDELFARLRSCLRRTAGASGPLLRAGELQLDLVSRELSCKGQRLTMPVKELAVLEVMMRNHGRFVPRARLEASIYNWDSQVGSNTVEVYISHLRKRLGSEAIETLRGVGYRLL
ncbi:MAG: DNA-binding response regulator [Halioglobus sp.]|nr:DNA-binding response regulator [Halioglobus sp.]|tara:strand:- start:2175 stop:2828 length:654 start_codon:yes stop_codon:yes gene_type:complete